jgi:hypothetical protein
MGPPAAWTKRRLFEAVRLIAAFSIANASQHELQFYRGARYAAVVQAEFLDLGTTLVARTSAGALPASFRPTIALGGRETRVLVEQTVLSPARGRRIIA